MVSHELRVVVIIALLFLSFVAAYLLRKFKITWFPESAATLILGALFAVIWHFIPGLHDVRFSPKLLFYVLLPAIIFESGFSVHRQRFFKNFGAILTFALVGTIITSVAVGGFMFVMCQLRGGYPDLSLLYFLIFGAIISATDPVATLSIFSKLNANPSLYSLVFGESMLNDAAAITLFRTLVTFFDQPLTVGSFFLATGKFILIFFGSAIIGVIMGALCSLVLKKTEIKEEPHLELILVIGTGYLAYFFCDVITLSGIVSIFFVGISIRHYAWFCFSETTQQSSLWFFEAFKEASETSIFALLGFTIFYKEKYDIFIIGMGIVACVFGRIFGIFPLSNILNLCRSGSNRISCKWQLVLWNAGLKGAVAVGLSLSHEIQDKPAWGVMETATHMVVIFSILFHGILTSPLVAMVNKYDKRKDTLVLKTKVHNIWSRVDKKYIIPFVSFPRTGIDDADTIHEHEYDHVPTHLVESTNLEGHISEQSPEISSDGSSDSDEFNNKHNI